MDRIFFHIDVNSAFLSWTAVDKLNHGYEIDLRTVPAIIGGDSSKRHGIVLAKSIPAKAYHIETAEPVVNALRKCPNLIVEPGNFEVYRKMSHAMFDYLYSLTPDVEPASIDEAYMDFTPIAHLYKSPIDAANMIREEIKNRFGFTVNVGISDRKVLAKMASDFKKPDRTHTCFSYEIKEKMWPLPVGDLFLCGKSSQEVLKRLEIKTIGDLANADISVINSNLKSIGQVLYEFANGIDDSGIVKEQPEAKGIGNSVTGAHDITTREEASDVILGLCDTVSSRMAKDGVLAGQLTVEIKYATFVSVSHQTGIADPVGSANKLHEVAMPLFDALWSGAPIRLLGVRATKLVSVDAPRQLTLFDAGLTVSAPAATSASAPCPVPPPAGDDSRQRELEAALHSIRARFGDSAVKRASTLSAEASSESPK